jgi:hypothetical protein
MRQRRGAAIALVLVGVLVLSDCRRSGTIPSQTATEAQRDHVVPALAALELEVRSRPEATVRTVDGTWVIASPSDAFQAAAGEDGCVGSRGGRFAIDYVCRDYAEILLIGKDGKILRAYPMPELHPGWIHATRDAIFAGRVADGCQPDSSLVRIDRKTLASTVVVFPQGGEGSDRRLLPSWRLATDAELPLIHQLVGVSGGVKVKSWIGPLRVDIPGVARFFAVATPGSPAAIPSGSC